MRLGFEWRHARKRWERNLVISKKASVEILTQGRAAQLGATGCAFVGSVSWDLTLGEASPDGSYGMRGAFVGSVSWDLTLGRAVQLEVGCGRCRNSQQSKNWVSLSSCRKTKSQEGHKHFVPEQRESSVFCVFRMHMDILQQWSQFFLCMVSILPLIFHSFSLLSKPLEPF